MMQTIQHDSTGYRFVSQSFDSIASDWRRLQALSDSSHIFSTYELSQLWWQHFGSSSTLYLGSIQNNDRIIGIAPLRIQDGIVQFIGSFNICDYLDFIVEPNQVKTFFDILFTQLKNDGLTRLELSPLRPDSSIMTYLTDAAYRNDLTITRVQEDVTFELHLPDNWDSYLQTLPTKQRHELRRKIRRVSELGDYQYSTLPTVDEKNIDIFLNLFRISRDDKQSFLTPDMENYFRELIRVAAEQGWLELNFMSIKNTSVAATLCFHFKDTTYLYNSGYAPEFKEFSVGLVSKALGIKTSIENKRKVYDFLKGSEIYKQHLGGKEIPLYHLSINLKP